MMLAKLRAWWQKTRTTDEPEVSNQPPVNSNNEPLTPAQLAYLQSLPIAYDTEGQPYWAGTPIPPASTDPQEFIAHCQQAGEAHLLAVYADNPAESLKALNKWRNFRLGKAPGQPVNFQRYFDLEGKELTFEAYQQYFQELTHMIYEVDNVDGIALDVHGNPYWLYAPLRPSEADFSAMLTYFEKTNEVKKLRLARNNPVQRALLLNEFRNVRLYQGIPTVLQPLRYFDFEGNELSQAGFEEILAALQAETVKPRFW